MAVTITSLKRGVVIFNPGMKFIIITFAGALLLLFSAPAEASDTSVIVSRPFVEVSGGSDFYIEGVGVNPTASFQLGVGYRWPQLALGASFGWTHNLDWNLGVLCDHWGGCVSDFGGLPRDLFGGVVYGRIYPVIVAKWLQPYLQAGMGFFLVTPKSSGDETAWAYTMRFGIGIEFGLSEYISLSMEAFYANTHFPPPDDFTEDAENHVINTSGSLVIYF
jgi:opacity protein-like surface antigen